jgi:hypothetical protein
MAEYTTELLRGFEIACLAAHLELVGDSDNFYLHCSIEGMIDKIDDKFLHPHAGCRLG